MIEGVARVIAPREKVRRPRVVLPEVHLHVQGAQYARLIAATEALDPVRTAVVHPCDALSLTGALEAARQGMIVPVLVGPQAEDRSRGQRGRAQPERGRDDRRAPQPCRRRRPPWRWCARARWRR